MKPTASTTDVHSSIRTLEKCKFLEYAILIRGIASNHLNPMHYINSNHEPRDARWNKIKILSEALEKWGNTVI